MAGSRHRVFEIYNSILSIHQLLENSDLSLTIQNSQLLQFAKQQCKLQHPTYDDLNFILAQCLSGATSTLRFHCEPTVNTTLLAINTLLVPFPRLHFLSLYHSPFYGNSEAKYNDNASGIINKLLENSLAKHKLEDGKMLTASFVYRGSDENAIEMMDDYMQTLQQHMADDFVSWIPSNIRSAFVYDGDNFVYKPYAPLIATAIINTTSIKSVWQRLSAEFFKIYKRKVYLHWYKGEGMDEMEFQYADKNVRDLITEYQDKQDAVVDLDEDREDEEDGDEDEEEEEEEDDDDGDF